MSTMPTPPGLFTGLVDDASMFPPGNASAETAVRDHLRHRNSWYAGLVGPLLVHFGRWHEFELAHSAAASPEIRVVLIGSTRTPGPPRPGVHVAGYEARATELPLSLPRDGLPLAAELIDPDRYHETLDAIAAARASGHDVIAKYRTGGETADSFPSEATAAQVISSAVSRRVPLKCTAGLHHAIRHTDVETGLEQHGFLNLMVTMNQARVRGPDAAVSAATLACRDAEVVVAAVRSWTAEEAAVVRRCFVSFGCCGVEDPIGDLVTLGLVERPEKTDMEV